MILKNTRMAALLVVAVVLNGATTLVRGALNPDPNLVIPEVAGVPSGSPDTWSGASTLRIFTTDNATGHRQIYEPTTLYVRHDSTNLYAGWICEDSQGDPVAFDRSPMDNLTLDESVQIVMGAPGEGKIVDIGGYDGSQDSELAPVSHYYEFTANATGAVSRSYNETLLPDPWFNVEVTPMSSPTGWYAVMTIPWAAAGIDPQDVSHTNIYFNAFRFNHSIRYGWYLPAFGNYAGMPFGEADLTGTTPTVEPPQTGVPVPTGGYTPVATDADIDDVELEYYPLSRKVTAVFPADASMRAAYLTIPSQSIQVSTNLSNIFSTTLTAVVPVLPEGTNFTAIAQINSLQKNEIFTALDTADWYDTPVSSNYVDQTVPYPWAAPQLTTGTVQLAHGEVAFGDAVLPQQITVKSRDILRAPIMARIKMSGGSAADYSGATATAIVEPTRIDLRTSSPGMVEMRNMVDFDGFMAWRLRLNGVDTRDLEELTLTIPFASGVAKYVNRGNLQSTVALGGYDYSANGGPIWVGGESIGLGVSSDRTMFFSPTDGHQVQVVQQGSDEVDLVLKLVTATGQVPVSNQVFQLLLLPTPSRTESPPPTYDKMSLLFEEWSDYQGYPDTNKLSYVQQAAADAHADTNKLYLYFGQVIATNAPEADRYGIEWFAPPERNWYSRSYEPGQDVPCLVSCFRYATGDLLVDRIEMFAEDAGIDGVYLDGLAYPFGCDNPSHDDGVRPVQFDDDVRTGRIIGHRQFLKRLRGIFDARGEQAPLWAHNGGGLTWNTLSLVDYLYEGEQLVRYRDGYLLSPEATQVGYSGKAFGFRGLFLPHIYADATGLKDALALSLVHDMEISLGAYNSPVEDEFFALPRGDTNAMFHPYWEDQVHLVRKSSDGACISYYRSSDEAMLVAANLQYAGTQKVKLGLENMFGAPVERVEEIGTGKLYELDGSELNFALPEGGFRVFRVLAGGIAPEPPEPLADPPAFDPISGYDASDWERSFHNPGGTINSTNDLPLKLVSFAGQSAGTIKLIPLLPDTFTAQLKLCHEGNFRIRVGDLNVVLDTWNGWQVAGTSDGDPWGASDATQRWPNGSFYSAPDKEVLLEISITDGRVTLVYDGLYVLDNVLLENPQSSYELSFECWGGQWLMLDVDSIVPEATLSWEDETHPTHQVQSEAFYWLLDTVVTSNGTIIPGDGFYTNNAVLTVTATPPAGMQTYWSGDINGCTINIDDIIATMNQDRQIVATIGEKTANTVPYTETFEPYADGFQMPGTNGWSSLLPTAGVVTTNADSIDALAAYSAACGYPVAATHDKVLEVRGKLANTFNMVADQVVWVDKMMQATAVHSFDSELLDGAQLAFYFNTNGHPVVWHRDMGGGTNRWTEIPEVTASGDQWVRLTFKLDYQTVDPVNHIKYFQMRIDGAPLTNTLAKTSNNGSGSPGGSWFAMPTEPDRVNLLVFDGGFADIDDLVVGPDSTLRFDVVVDSAYGQADPPAGTNGYGYGDTVTFSVTNTMVAQGGGYYEYIGWTIAGGSPSSGTGTTVTITITNDVELTWVWQQVPNPANTIPYTETFESFAHGFTMSGTNGWSDATFTNAVVVTNTASIDALAAYSAACGYPVAATHDKVLEVRGAITNSFGMVSNQVVWVDKMMQATSVHSFSSNLLDGAQLAFYFNADGHPMVWHRDVGGGTNRWTEIPEVRVLRDQWVRLTFKLDYQTVDPVNHIKYFQVRVDGSPLTNALARTANDGAGSPGGNWFAMPTEPDRMSLLVFDGIRADIDDLVVATNTPDALARDVVVVSAHGQADPAVGTHNYAYGDNVSLSLSNSPFSQGIDQYACTGWGMVGHAPASGTGTNMAITLTNDLVLTWLWTTNNTLAPMGTPEWWLVLHGLTNGGFAAQELLDDDNDGLLAWHEWVSDTIPTDSNSVLKITSFESDETGGTLHWKGGVQAVQVLERCANLVSGPWAPVLTNEPPTPITNSFTDAEATNLVSGFYRVKAER